MLEKRLRTEQWRDWGDCEGAWPPSVPPHLALSRSPGLVVEKAPAPAGPSVPRGRPRTQSGARGRRGEGEEGEGIEEETPEARGEEGRPSPSAWVRGRGVRWRPRSAHQWLSSWLAGWGAPSYSSPPHLGLRWPEPIKHLCLHNRLRPLAPAEGLLAENTKISIWV